MKIKLRSDDPGPSGPTEWSEMNDWLANLREDADPEPAATAGPGSTAEPQSWGPSDPAPGQSWGPSDPGVAQGWQAVGDPAEPQGAASAAQPLSAAVPEPEGAAEAQPFGPAQPQGAAEPAATAEPQATGVTAEPYGAAALDEGDGFYGHYGDYDLDGGHPGPDEADAAQPEVATESHDTAEADEPSATGVAAVADEAGAAAAGGAEVTSESYGAPSAVATDLLETPDTRVAGDAAVAGGTAGWVALGTWVASPAPVASGATAPAAATPGAIAPAPAPVAEPEPVVRALIGEDLRTPMVWCELEPGSCVSWHGDREALGMADVRARAIAAGWRIDALGRLTCPQCQQRKTTFRATQQVVLWNRTYALTRAAREAARQGSYAYPQPAFYPR
jgi:hypothetical protein